MKLNNFFEIEKKVRERQITAYYTLIDFKDKMSEGMLFLLSEEWQGEVPVMKYMREHVHLRIESELFSYLATGIKKDLEKVVFLMGEMFPG